MKLITAAIATLSLACATACGGTSTSPSQSGGTATAITVNGSPLATGTFQLTATARMSDGGTRDVTASAQWESSNRSIATISTAGMVTVLAAGQVEFRATYLGVAGALQLSLNAPPSHGTFVFPASSAKSRRMSALSPGRTSPSSADPIRDGSAVSDANGFYQLTGISAGTSPSSPRSMDSTRTGRDYRLPETRRRMDGWRLCPRPMQAALPRPRAVRTARGAGRKARQMRARRMAEWPIRFAPVRSAGTRWRQRDANDVDPTGMRTGVRCSSMSRRFASSHGGSFSPVPSEATSSSAANPGDIVATSNSTPPGSRK